MSAVKDAAGRITAALTAIENVRYHPDPGGAIDPPGTVLGPPALTWEGLCSGPTSARWLVYVVENATEGALERLWDLVPTVADALDDVEDVTVGRADPGTFIAGGVELPCYEIQIDVSL